jgi:RsiW-degrading membrane proteinase PrsW (M82 family)
MVGIGFAFTENILYLAAAYIGRRRQAGGIGGATAPFVVRCVFSPFAHPLFTRFTGIGSGSPSAAAAARRGSRAAARVPARGRRARGLERLDALGGATLRRPTSC